MANQPLEVEGYREISPEEFAVMNAVKAHAEATKELLGKVHQLNSERFGASALRPVRTAQAAQMGSESSRWIALAKTQLQQGFMALNRAIELPTRF